MLTPPLEAGTKLWGFQRGRASPLRYLNSGGVKSPPAKWLRSIKKSRSIHHKGPSTAQPQSKKRRMAAKNAKDAKRDPKCRGAIHRALISAAVSVFVGCASCTGQSRNVSRKGAKFRKRKFPSGAKLSLTPVCNRFIETLDMETVSQCRQRYGCHAERSEASRIFSSLRRRDSSPWAQNDITTQSHGGERGTYVANGDRFTSRSFR